MDDDTNASVECPHCGREWPVKVTVTLDEDLIQDGLAKLTIRSGCPDLPLSNLPVAGTEAVVDSVIRRHTKRIVDLASEQLERHN